MERFSTSEGKRMARILADLNPEELARFESFQRSTLKNNAVSTFVASRLLDNRAGHYLSRGGAAFYFGSTTDGRAPFDSRDPVAMLHRCPGKLARGGTNIAAGEERETNIPPLRDLVACDSAQEITVVVSTLAKMYAQRLVRSSRSVATVGGHPIDAPLLPQHILEAHRCRVKAGLDPGFFMQPLRGSGSESISSGRRTRPVIGCGGIGDVGGSTFGAAALGITDRNKIKLQATLAAQEAFDESVGNTGGDSNFNDIENDSNDPNKAIDKTKS